MLLTDPFMEAKEILDYIEKHDYEAYFVGGCIRDLLLNREIGDIDIATSAPPSVIQQIFNKVIPVGLEHGTVIVRHRHQSYEVTTFRVDGDYSDQRHPDTVKFVQTIDQDLKRRDFTINALAMDKKGKLIDLFDGKKDIEEKVIRTVGNGYDRFMEDPLRVIRALRFSSQLGFSISNETLSDMKLVKSETEHLAVERTCAEITKLFAGNHVNNGISYLINTEVYKYLPVMIEYPYIIKLFPNKMKPLQSFSSVIAFFHYLDPAISIHYWVKEWKCSNKIKYGALSLYDALAYYKNNGVDRWLVYSLPSAYYEEFSVLTDILFPDKVTMEQINSIDIRVPIKSKKDLAINGNDVREMFPEITSGPWIRNTLHAIEMEVVIGKIANSKNDLKEWIKWNQHVTD
ncbi:CCA tRNA nucleotidyltransferase [Virgibacillus doumboii]|uniref:CCA tRNA nucleotidyltransferase n=1 Tax=Virgibacillus doumboii TaxID=2697503 RepID=UPI0013E0966F|nr:CCA tRNA nucleotidyltransferase [Virgibacillus doumboii]